MASDPNTLTLNVGQSGSIGGIPVKLLAVKPHPSDATPQHAKAEVTLEVGGKDQVTVGEYAMNAVVWRKSLLALVASTPRSATLRVTPFSFTWDTKAFEPGAKVRAVDLGQALVVKDLKVTVTSLTHVSEYGSYWVLPVEVEQGGKKSSYNQGSFNHLGFMFSLVPTGLESAQLVVRPIQAGEPFVLDEGGSLEVQVDGKPVLLELKKATQNEKAHRLEYDFRLGPKHEAVLLVLPFVEQFREPPPGKIDRRRFTYDHDAAKVKWGGLVLEKVPGSTEDSAVRRGPFRLTR